MGEEADVAEAIAEHGEPLEAHAPGVAGVNFGVDTAVFEDFGMDHAGAADFKPAGVLAEAAAGAVAVGALEVDFEAGLDEGKVAGAETGLDCGL